MRKARPDCQHTLLSWGGDGPLPSPVTPFHAHSIASPPISRTSGHRPKSFDLVEEVLEREKPDIIESGDPYQLAWKAIASGRGLDIPVVGFYHSHFPEAYIRSVAKLLWIDRHRHRRRRQPSLRKKSLQQPGAHFVPSPMLASLLRDWGVERVVSIDLGVDAEVFCPNGGPSRALRRELRILTIVDYSSTSRLRHQKRMSALFLKLLNFSIERRLLNTICWPSAMAHLQTSTGAIAPGNSVRDLGCNTARKRPNWPRSTAHSDLFVHPGIRRPLAWSPSRVRHAGRLSSASAAAIWTASSFGINAIGQPKTHRTPWRRRSRPNSAKTSRRWSLRASIAAREHYSWKVVFERIFSFYEEVVDSFTK